MKIARVIPISKNKNEFKNYRPIIILPQFSKILEKLFEKRLNKYIEKLRSLSDNQHGFMEGYSTAMALTDQVDNIVTAIDKKITHIINILRP